VSQLQDPIDQLSCANSRPARSLRRFQPFLGLGRERKPEVPARVWRDAFEGFLEDDFADEPRRHQRPRRLVATRRARSSTDQDIVLAAIPNATLLV
jgi:hypothetical protein